MCFVTKIKEKAFLCILLQGQMCYKHIYRVCFSKILMLFEDLSISQSAFQKTMPFSKANFYKKIAEGNFPSVVNQNSSRRRFSIESCRKVYELYLEKLQVQEKVNVFYNFKGGTGKTTICFQMATMLAICGFNVLTIDLDPQAHLTNVLRFDENKRYKTAYDFIINGSLISDCIYPIFEGLHAIPSNLELTRIEVPLSQKTRREETLSKLISPLKEKYDFILIDTNPAISNLNVNALFAADKINIICETHPFSLNGLCILIEELEKIFYDLQKPLNLKVIANKFESKTATSQEVLGILRSDYSKEMMNTVVRKCEDLNLASKKKSPIISFASAKSPAFEDIVDLFMEFIDPHVKKKA